MKCCDVLKLIHARIDEELIPDLAQQVDRHLNQCRSCAQEEADLRALTAALNDMPPVHVPATLAGRTLAAFRKNLNKPNLLEWWQSLSLLMRSAACGIVMAGIISGVILYANVISFESNSANLYVQTLIQTEGILP